MEFWRWIVGGGLAGATMFVIAVFMKAPSHDRDWVDHLAATPSVTWNDDGDTVTIAPIRDWQYLPLRDGIAILEVFQQRGTYRIEDLQDIWFILEPHPGFPLMAHTFVVFDFGPIAEGGGGMLGLTIEARKTEGERYNPVLGAFNKYELVYVWAEPRDLMTRRASLLGHALEAYKLTLPPEEKVGYFERLVERTAAISKRPRFYNTLGSNCTNELAKAAGLSWDSAFLFTGGAAKALFEHGVIEGERFSTVQENAQIAEALRNRSWRIEEFNQMLRGHASRLSIAEE
ncbi:MAG: DUF4105 domain-containing protein [Pseudomonadota bacterium]